MTTPEQIIKIIQTIPNQYMPYYTGGLISISIPYNLYFKPEDVIIEDRNGMIEIKIGSSYVHLFKNSFNVLIGLHK